MGSKKNEKKGFADWKILCIFAGGNVRGFWHEWLCKILAFRPLRHGYKVAPWRILHKSLIFITITGSMDIPSLYQRYTFYIHGPWIVRDGAETGSGRGLQEDAAVWAGNGVFVCADLSIKRLWLFR